MINLNNKAVVLNHLNTLQDYELLDLYSEYADNNGYEPIHNLDKDTINEMYSNAWDAIADSNNKGFNENDYYFTYNGHGHMITFNYPMDENSPIDIDDIADWIISNDSYDDYNIDVMNDDDKMVLIEDSLEMLSLEDITIVISLLDLDFDNFDEELETIKDYRRDLIVNINDHIQYDTPLLDSVLVHLKLAE